MFTIYRVKPEELDATFLENLKTTFRGKEIEIAVSEVDETDYLLRPPKNREHLLSAVKDVEAGYNVVTPDPKQFR